MAEKVFLVTRILHATVDNEESYAYEILNKQLANGWNSLSKEVEDICSRVGLSIRQWPMPACYQYIHKAEEVMKADDWAAKARAHPEG